MTLNFDIEEYIEELIRRLDAIGAPHAALAKEARVSPAQLSRWLTGQTEPRVSSLKPLERAMERLEASFRAAEAADHIDQNGR